MSYPVEYYEGDGFCDSDSEMHNMGGKRAKSAYMKCKKDEWDALSKDDPRKKGKRAWVDFKTDCKKKSAKIPSSLMSEFKKFLKCKKEKWNKLPKNAKEKKGTYAYQKYKPKGCKKHTVAQLKKLLKKAKVSGYSKLKKSGLMSLARKHKLI